jgi:hypothetical protein
MNDSLRKGFAIIFKEFEGFKFNLDTWRFEEPKK